MVVVAEGDQERKSEGSQGARDPEPVGSSYEVYEERRHRRPTWEDEFDGEMGRGETGEGGFGSGEENRKRPRGEESERRMVEVEEVMRGAAQKRRRAAAENVLSSPISLGQTVE